jgi:hypothetical protein
LDGWLLAEDGRCLLPSRAADCRQRQEMDAGVRITTETEMPGLTLTSSAGVELESGLPVCKLRLQARADTNAWLVLALRPYNPEGISFINQVSLSKERKAWTGVWRKGLRPAFSMIPRRVKSLATTSLGWAPTCSQWIARSSLMTISAGSGKGS